MFPEIFKELYSEEELEWMLMTASQRLKESQKLWSIYLSLGGSLAPQPDLQSPFYSKKTQGKSSSHRGSSNHNVRSSRV